MPHRTATWRPLLTTALVVLSAAALVTIWVLEITGGLQQNGWNWIRLVSGVGGIALGTIGILSAQQSRRLRRLQAGIARGAEIISRGEPDATVDERGAPELARMNEALLAARRRISRQADLADRHSRMVAALLPQLREGVIVADASGNIALINPAAIDLLHLAVSSDPARYPGLALERCIPHLDVQQMLLPGARRAGDAAAGETGGEWEARIQVEHARGERTLLAHCSEIVLPESDGGGAGDVRGRMVVLTDVTELNRAIQVRTDFVANASHELRTPVSTIRAAVETLQGLDLGAESDMARRFVDIVDRQSARLEALAQDLLDLGRVETSARQFEAQPVALRELFAELTAHFQERVSRKGLHWDASVEPAVPSEVSTSPSLLRLALDNLVDNAIKFVDAGGRVSVLARRAPKAIEIEVADNGCGIPAEDQQRVFERFYQVDRGRSGPQRGSGLGLAIVRNAVEALKGNVHLESVPGKGTRVCLTLPLGRA